MKPLCLLLIAFTLTKSEVEYYTGPGAVKYVSDGAIITKPGKVKLKSPDPMVFEVVNYQKCQGLIGLCYKAVDNTDKYAFFCGMDYCFITVSHRRKTAAGFDEEYYGSNLRFIRNYQSDFSCEPNVEDGYHHWLFWHLPTDCEVKVIGAIDPNKDEYVKLKLAIYVLCGIAAVVILIAIGSVAYCLFIRPKFFASTSRTLGSGQIGSAQ
uniref:CX domain-containing protein n=1 Tax=Panagrellus redivivus TaxID=6233 RepID=A0A7E4V5D7_PANRE